MLERNNLKTHEPVKNVKKQWTQCRDKDMQKDRKNTLTTSQ